MGNTGFRIWSAVHANDRAELANTLKYINAYHARYEHGINGPGTALMYAASLGRADLAGMLIDAGFGVNYKSVKNGRTAVMYAAAANQTATVELLLTKYKAALDVQDKDGATALMLAVINGHNETAQLLLKHGADKMIKNKERKSVADLATLPEIKAILEQFEPLVQEAAALEEKCASIATQLQHAPACRDVVNAKDKLCVELAAAKETCEDYRRIAELIAALQEKRTQIAQLPVAEEDFLTLRERHTALVMDVDAMCKKLIKTEFHVALARLADCLTALKNQDLSALPNHADPVLMVGKADVVAFGRCGVVGFY